MPFLHLAVVRASIVIPLLAVLQPAHSQKQSRPLPRFEDYLVKRTFRGTPHPPILATPEQRRFRTKIRQGVAKGWGVWTNGQWGKEQEKPGPNFAGHYIVINWGCGTGCLRTAMSDAETGVVYNPPLSDSELHMRYAALGAAQIEFRRDSRLMIIRPTLHAERGETVARAFYFLWENNHWRLLRRVPIEE